MGGGVMQLQTRIKSDSRQARDHSSHVWELMFSFQPKDRRLRQQGLVLEFHLSRVTSYPLRSARLLLWQPPAHAGR